jgi:hypothetical protein
MVSVVSATVTLVGFYCFGLPVLLFVRRRGHLHVVTLAAVSAGTGAFTGAVAGYALDWTTGNPANTSVELLAMGAGLGLLVGACFALIAGRELQRGGSAV